MNPDDQPHYWNTEGDDAPAAASVDPSSPEQAPPIPSNEIQWEASEYLDHNNGFWWYFAFFAVAVVLIGFSIWFAAWTFIPVVVVMAIAGLIHVRRPPRVVRYVLDNDGLEIDGQLHAYLEFKSFSVIRDGAFFAILLIPARRFSPSTIVYFDEADGEQIVDAFGTRLPMENRGLDPVDRLLRFIRF